ncbi:MAG: hypothetical protein AABY22_05195, partial [Nanoarchaeota archaeon]
TATAVAGGNTAVWATAHLDDNNDGISDRICQTPGNKDTDINVTGPTAPPPTSTPTLPPGVTPTPTPTPPPAPPPVFYSISGKIFPFINSFNSDFFIL